MISTRTRSIVVLALLLAALLHPLVHQESALFSATTQNAQNDCSCAQRVTPAARSVSDVAVLAATDEVLAAFRIPLHLDENARVSRGRAPPTISSLS